MSFNPPFMKHLMDRGADNDVLIYRFLFGESYGTDPGNRQSIDGKYYLSYVEISLRRPVEENSNTG